MKPGQPSVGRDPIRERRDSNPARSMRVGRAEPSVGNRAIGRLLEAAGRSRVPAAATRAAHHSGTPAHSMVQRRVLTDKEVQTEVKWVLSGDSPPVNAQAALTVILRTMLARVGEEADLVGLEQMTLATLRTKLKGHVDKDDEAAIKKAFGVAVRKSEIQSLAAEDRPKPPYDDDATREASFDRNDPSTWEKKAIVYKNGLDSSLSGATDAGAKIDALEKCDLSGNSKAKGKKLSIIPDTVFHTHLQTGSWGMAFVYRLEGDFKVTPVAFDIAKGRVRGNEYKWESGGNGFNSSAAWA